MNCNSLFVSYARIASGLVWKNEFFNFIGEPTKAVVDENKMRLLGFPIIHDNHVLSSTVNFET